MAADDLKARLYEAIDDDLDIPEPYALVIEAESGTTWAFLRDQWSGANRFAVNLGVVHDTNFWAAASRAAKELRQRLHEVSAAKTE